MYRKMISLYLDKTQIEALRMLTGYTRIKMAVYIREGVDMVLSRYQKELKAALKKEEGK